MNAACGAQLTPIRLTWPLTLYAQFLNPMTMADKKALMNDILKVPESVQRRTMLVRATIACRQLGDVPASAVHVQQLKHCCGVLGSFCFAVVGICGGLTGVIGTPAQAPPLSNAHQTVVCHSDHAMVCRTDHAMVCHTGHAMVCHTNHAMVACPACPARLQAVQQGVAAAAGRAQGGAQEATRPAALVLDQALGCWFWAASRGARLAFLWCCHAGIGPERGLQAGWCLQQWLNFHAARHLRLAHHGQLAAAHDCRHGSAVAFVHTMVTHSSTTGQARTS